MATRRGLGEPGRQRIRKNWEDIESGSDKFSWLVGGEPSESTLKLREQIAEQNEKFQQQVASQDVNQLVDLYPDKSNYYQGPSKSTRVMRHRFVMEQSNYGSALPSGLGTVFVKFTNLRERKDGTVYEGKFHGAVYAYFHVPYSVYERFTETNSKGQFINNFLNNYDYTSLGQDDSVFTTDYKD